MARLRLRDGRDDERVHAEARVVSALLDEARVDDVVDAVDGDARLGDVGGDDDLARARGRRVKDARLHLGGKGGVDGEDDELGHRGAEGLHALVEDLARGVDLLLTGQEEQDVALRLGEVDLHDGNEGGVEVVRLGLLGVEDLDGEGAAGDGEDGALVEVAREFFGVKSGGGDDELEVGSALERL